MTRLPWRRQRIRSLQKLFQRLRPPGLRLKKMHRARTKRKKRQEKRLKNLRLQVLQILSYLR